MTDRSPHRYRAIGASRLDEIEPLRQLDPALRFDMRVVANVLPFRVNRHVVDELIRWEDAPDDPVFQLVFPQRGMLSDAHFERMAEALWRVDESDGGTPSAASKAEIRRVADGIRAELNPHPAGQLDQNRPTFEGRRVDGLQHKYRETVLFFPAAGQTCHAYCTFCFRWAQFVGDSELRMAESDGTRLVRYLAEHPEVSDVLVTGGDPAIVRTEVLARSLEPLLAPELAHVQTVRIGTKALTFWPARFVSDPDADALLRLIERLVAGGKHVAIMAHVGHWQELDHPLAREAVRRLRDAGAVIRSQAPLLRHVNDDAATWARTWTEQVRMGIVPYYLFVERDTGARAYFELPLARAHAIYNEAIRRCSGLARTARGPSMSCVPGKVAIDGVVEVAGEKVFALRFLQARDPEWVGRPFFASFDAHATWFDQLRPAFGERDFFFEPALRAQGVATPRVLRERVRR
ncbi:L-lysine 2,3-aminomutase [Planctomycetes bacterium Pla163]|uniref:L-lysine 2,3-aminomutase n=1 Tax=Rohdeia mirabilis TaxID=2528008 RepID=A0A518CWC4_9BACT|nr:L-lysine 2,3-aminomutase [Planctomycetes bacterium Pla163]